MPTLHAVPPTPAADLDRPTMSTSSLAAAALLIDDDGLAPADDNEAGDDALHCLESLPFVTAHSKHR